MLLERDDELSMVSEALRSAHQGCGSLLVISGPVGNGKSELLRALPGAAAQEDVRVLSAGASALEQDYAFGVTRQLLGPALFEADGKTRERWLSGAAGLAELVLSEDLFDAAGTRPVSVRQAVLFGLLKLVEQMSAEQTSMILVDGLQWADEPSLQWLARVTSRLIRLRILVVVTVWDGEPTSNRPTVQAITGAAVRVLRPRLFSLAGTRALVADQYGEAGHEEFVLACHETTGGNPLFLKSILFNLSVNGVPPRAEHAEQVRSLRPAELRDRLIDCIGSQAEPVRNVAKAMAIVSARADAEVIRKIAGLDAAGCSEAMHALHALGLLACGQRPGFVHVVVQDAIEESMTAEERETLHIRAAKALHGSENAVEQRADQMLATTSPQGPWMADVLRTAASTAMRRGAPELASRYLRRALLDTSTNGEDRARLLVELATAERAFDVGASVRHINHALPLLSSARDRAAAIVNVPPTLLGAAPPGVRALIRPVFDELGDVDELSGADRELKLRIEARMRYLDRTDPAALADGSTRLAEFGGDPPMGTPAERELLTLLLFAVTLSSRRSSPWVARIAERIVEREPALSSHVHTALPLLVPVLAAAESTGRLTSWLGTALDHARRHGTVVEQALIRMEQAVVALHTGRVTDARRAATDAFELGALEWDTADPTTVIAMASVATGLRDVELTRNVLDICGTAATNACPASMLHLMRGTLAMAEGDLRLALERYQECGRHLGRSGMNNPVLFPWRALAADLYRRLGDLDAARELAEEDCLLAAEWGAPAALGRAKRILGEVIGGEAGIAVLRESVDILESSANALELARSLLKLGTELREQGHPETVGHLRRSHRLALDCGEVQLAELAQASALEAASRQTERPTLTKAELLVARLAAAGDTNRDIAQLLGVSRRAVEKHLTSSYRKLGIHHRGALAGVLSQAGADRGSTGGHRRP
ncbi:ATP-binding protein [Streptomyces spongiae]|uniref:AAA family ATPase n=1 Tax=Streptomyces spongiae TaxID=565072 RepID=A0A5N8XEX9_9ACTN|nr:AAA family ATPase [Streptomyces spongiae]MPY58083.1 AAA family ATPase [Streptomyces spongiae]